MNLPLFISIEAWSEYESMRRRIKKPLTELGATRLLKRCEVLQAKGWDANEALLVASDCCWLSVYPPKDMTIPDRPRAPAEQTADFVRSLEAAKANMSPPPAKILAMRRRA